MEKTVKEGLINPRESYLLSILHSVWKNQCIAVIIELRIPELLGNIDNPSISVEEIAAKSGCQTSTNLYAMMTLLAHWGIGTELEDKHFSTNQSMELLRRDKGPSLGHVFQYHRSEEHMSALTLLDVCVKQDKPAFVLKHGMDHFSYMYDLKKNYDPPKSSEHNMGSLNRRQEFAEIYSSAVAYYSNLSTLPQKGNAVNNVFKAFPWSTCNTLVDMAGSLGSFLATILKLPGCEHIQGYVLEFPEVVDEAKAKINSLGIPEHRIKFVKQDLTESFSKDLNLEADTVACKGTISMYLRYHSTVRKILSNCRSLFASKGGRLLIIDYVAPDNEQEKVGFNGMEIGAQSMHWLSIAAYPILTKKGWIESLDKLGIKELGYQVEHFYDTFPGGQAIIELSYNPLQE